jgi:hypothetical protein
MDTELTSQTIDPDEGYESIPKDSQLVRWTRVLITVGLVLGAIWLLTPGCASAHDWKRSDLDGWYSGLMRPHVQGSWAGGTSCCSKQDCHTTEAEVRNGKWWARLGKPLDHDGGERDWELEDWKQIPDDAIVRGANGNPVANQAGEAVICHPTVWKNGKVDVENTIVFCFVPPDQT